MTFDFGAVIVDNVNPKLKSFDRPVYLAVVIGGSAFFFAVLMLIIFMVDCPVIKDGPMGIAPKAGIDSMVKEKTIECVRQVFTMHANGAAGSYGDTNYMRIEVCDPGADFKFCETDGNVPVDRGTNPCLGATPGTQRAKGDLYAFYYDARVCRTFGEALGLALAYTAYIEIGVTLIVLVLFTKFGMVKRIKGGNSIWDIARGDQEVTQAEMSEYLKAKKMQSEAKSTAEKSMADVAEETPANAV